MEAFLAEHPEFELCDGGTKIRYRKSGKKFDIKNMTAARAFVAGTGQKNKKHSTALQSFLQNHPDFELCDFGTKVRFLATGKKFDSQNVSVLQAFIAGKKYEQQKQTGVVGNGCPLQVGLASPEDLVPVMVPEAIADRMAPIAKQLHVQQQISARTGRDFSSASAAIHAVRLPLEERDRLLQQNRAANQAKHVGFR